MYLKKEKISLWKWIGLFFGAMILFTILSRAIYQHSTAVVTTKMPTSGTITHTVQIAGKTLQNQEQAVTTVAGLRVASVCVNEGQQVNQGDVLFTLDLDYLEETILTQKQNMEKQRLSVQDAWSQNAATQKRRSNAQAQAQENYNSAVSQAETALDRAARDLERAKTALENYYKGITEDKAQEEALVSECQKAQSNLAAAKAALEQLKTEIAGKIKEAIDCAEQEQTQSSQQETAATEENSPLPEPVVASVTPPGKDAIADDVSEEYAQRLSDAESAVKEAERVEMEAKAALETYRNEQQTDSPVRSEQELLDAVEKAQQTYDDARSALENAKTTYGRAINSANLPDGSNHTAQIGQITYDQMTLTLSKLETLLDVEGKILSPVDGIVTRCNVQAGEKTSDTTAMLLADLSQGCKFSGLATEEDSQYIGVGDKVLLQTSNGKAYKDLPVTTFSTTEEPDGGYRLTVQIPAGNLALGANVHLSFTKKSQPYSCCVPLSALRLDNRNQTFVLVVQEVTSVMGTELQAKKVNVTVLEQNETMAALAEGTLGSKDKVIVGSDKTIDIGSRVRVE